MAVYYWTGLTSSDMNNAANWTTWSTIGSTGPIPASRKPFWGDDIVFRKLGTTGGTVWPIFGPSGTLVGTGGTSGLPGGTGETLGTRYLRTVYVFPDYDNQFGTTGSYVNLYADQITLLRTVGVTNNVYLNVLPHPDPAGVTLANVSIGCSAAGACFYIKGVGNIKSAQNIPWAGNIYLYDFAGTLKQDNIASSENYYFNTSTQLDGDHTFRGKMLKFTLKKDFHCK